MRIPAFFCFINGRKLLGEHQIIPCCNSNTTCVSLYRVPSNL